MLVGEALTGTAKPEFVPKFMERAFAQPIKEVKHDTLRAKVYDELRSAIMKGAFEPGRALTVRGLAAAIGTSPTPVREALQQLTAEMALSAEPNKSYRIPEITAERVQQLREVRAALEGLAAEKAAKLITTVELNKLQSTNDRMLKAINKQDAKSYLSSNEDFHFVIYKAARSDVLLNTIRSLWLQIGPTLNLLFRNIELVQNLDDYHQAALEALASGNAKAARKAIAQDIMTAGAYIEQETLREK